MLKDLFITLIQTNALNVMLKTVYLAFSQISVKNAPSDITSQSTNLIMLFVKNVLQQMFFVHLKLLIFITTLYIKIYGNTSVQIIIHPKTQNQ